MNTITKSMRLAKDQAEELREIAKQEHMSESALFKKWMLEGIRRYKIDRAVQAYCDEWVDIRSGAEMADMPYREFMKELEKHRIPILTDVTHFHEELLDLAKMFGDKKLEKIVNQTVAEESMTASDS